MDNKRLLAEVDVLKQIVPTACSNVIELCGRYLAASGKMPGKQYCRENVDCNDCPFEISEECTHEIVNKTIDECTLAMMKYADKLAKPEAVSAGDMDVLNDLLLSLRNHLDRATEDVDIKRTSNRIKALESIIHAVMKQEHP